MSRANGRSKIGQSSSENSEGANNKAPGADVAAKSPQPDLSPEARAKLAEIRSRVETSVGQLTLLLMQQSRYRHQALGDLNHLIIEPLLHNRIAIAYASGADGQFNPNPAPVGAAIWASVSDDVDAKIKEQVKAGVFPVRLSADEWASGGKQWLLDIVAINRNAASAVLLNFKKIVGDLPVRLHPQIGRTVDAEILKSIAA